MVTLTAYVLQPSNLKWKIMKIGDINMGTVFSALEKSNKSQENKQTVLVQPKSQKLVDFDNKEKIKKHNDDEFHLIKENIDPREFVKNGYNFPEEYQIIN